MTSSTTTQQKTATAETLRSTADVVEELRRAEAHLARRRQTACGPSETDRSAMRFILEAADDERPITPTDLAKHLGITTASTTAVLDRLGRGQMVELRQHPDDRRKRLVVPVDRSDDPDLIDPLTATIRELSDELSPHEAELVNGFLTRITRAVKRECQR